MATLRESGKKDWTSDSTLKHVKVGALQRIADACELMAKSYQQLIADRDYYQREYREKCQDIGHLCNQIRGLKSAITRMKKRDAGE